ncbi:protein kinase [Pontibacillus yanchengensis]|uniref:Protein kinase n=3 Tax=Pontibacillus yanchengensis TaxID=462910 RepID=A0ACC7VLT1_9BACI|nr:protein kinase [Pontibacillus yanchengensis]MYL55773.1 protein kinase [Pontibacillus yanchengensis]
MMNQPGKNQDIEVRLGAFVTGKWYNRSYRIIKKLGSGACGTVYLAEEGRKHVAIKFSLNSSSITTEVNVLKTFQKVQGKTLGPSLLDVDDWVQPNGEKISFYVMEYLRGKELTTFIKEHGHEWLGILVVQLLSDLQQLHETGWIFGDLKTENLIVTYPPAKLRWIDVGGTTQQGRAIKEYTEFYDRGYWGMGSRKAEASYDLFALAMVMLHLYHPKRFEKGTNPEKVLLSKLQQTNELKPYQTVIQKALYGDYTTSEQMKVDMQHILLKNTHTKTRHSTPSRMQKHKHQVKKTVKSSPPGRQSKYLWEGMGIVVVVCMFYIVYILLQWI